MGSPGILNKTTTPRKLFLLSVGISAYFLLLTGYVRSNLEFELVDAIHEMLTLPVLALSVAIAILSLIILIRSKFSNLLPLYSIILIVISIYALIFLS